MIEREIKEQGKNRNEQLIKAELKQVLSARDGVMAWKKELEAIELQEREEKGLNPEHSASKKREATTAIIEWSGYAHESFAQLDRQDLNDEEAEFLHDSMDAIDVMAGEYESQQRQAA